VWGGHEAQRVPAFAGKQRAVCVYPETQTGEGVCRRRHTHHQARDVRTYTRGPLTSVMAPPLMTKLGNSTAPMGVWSCLKTPWPELMITSSRLGLYTLSSSCEGGGPDTTISTADQHNCEPTRPALCPHHPIITIKQGSA
jgi:hypothetical protein